jgi:hypothetical protein
MPTPLRFAARFLAVLSIVALAQISLTPVGPVATPYASALSDLTGGGAQAATGCAFRTCLFRGERLFCESTTLAEKCAQKGTNCASSAC